MATSYKVGGVACCADWQHGAAAAARVAASGMVEQGEDTQTKVATHLT
jgi:hypothetical protein